MAIADKLTTIRTSLQNIKTAITGKGVTIDGDITTYADAIASIPVGVQLEMGTIMGSGSKILNLGNTTAKGKDNIAVFGQNAWAGVSICTAMSIDGENRCVRTTSSSATPTASSDIIWDKNAGTMTYTNTASVTWKNTCTYRWIAW